MGISNEIKALLTIKNKKRVDLSEYMGLALPQVLNNKFNRESWSAEDLIKVVSFLGGELVIKLDDREVKLTEKHIEKVDKEIKPIIK